MTIDYVDSSEGIIEQLKNHLTDKPIGISAKLKFGYYLSDLVKDFELRQKEFNHVTVTLSKHLFDLVPGNELCTIVTAIAQTLKDKREDSTPWEDIQTKILQPLSPSPQLSHGWIAAVSPNLEKLEGKFTNLQLRKVEAALNLEHNLENAITSSFGKNRKTKTKKGAVLIICPIKLLREYPNDNLINYLNTLTRIPGITLIIVEGEE